MPNNKHYRVLRNLCHDAYIDGQTDVKALAVQFGVIENTVRDWIKSGKWDAEREEERTLARNIERETRKAHLAALREYNANPKDANLQSLVGLLKQSRKELEPSKELLDYIIKFFDQTTDFLIEQGEDELLRSFQAIIDPLKDYLRRRNNG